MTEPLITPEPRNRLKVQRQCWPTIELTLEPGEVPDQRERWAGFNFAPDKAMLHADVTRHGGWSLKLSGPRRTPKGKLHKSIRGDAVFGPDVDDWQARATLDDGAPPLSILRPDEIEAFRQAVRDFTTHVEYNATAVYAALGAWNEQQQRGGAS